jgi:hypothetical protein
MDNHKIRYSKEFGWYIQNEDTKEYAKVPGTYDSRLDFAEFFNTKAEAAEFKKLYNYN